MRPYCGQGLKQGFDFKAKPVGPAPCSSGPHLGFHLSHRSLYGKTFERFHDFEAELDLSRPSQSLFMNNIYEYYQVLIFIFNIHECIHEYKYIHIHYRPLLTAWYKLPWTLNQQLQALMAPSLAIPRVLELGQTMLDFSSSLTIRKKPGKPAKPVFKMPAQVNRQ